MTDDWRYYHHAFLPTNAPHEAPDTAVLDDGSLWKTKGALLARWTSDWDCGHETEWWYVIKDAPLDLDSLKSKRRYEIKKGKKNFEVRRIDPAAYMEDLYRVTVAAFSGWPEKYRPSVTPEDVEAALRSGQTLKGWKETWIFAAFLRETGALSGYAVVDDYGSYASFNMLRTDPEAERLGVNAAAVAGILEAFEGRFQGGFYLNDGARAIRHETAFQPYLEKYFGFRKAYCTLNVRYRKGFGLLVKILYPFRGRVSSRTGLGSQISGILKMEEIRRSFL